MSEKLKPIISISQYTFQNCPCGCGRNMSKTDAQKIRRENLTHTQPIRTFADEVGPERFARY